MYVIMLKGMESMLWYNKYIMMLNVWHNVKKYVDYIMM